MSWKKPKLIWVTVIVIVVAGLITLALWQLHGRTKNNSNAPTQPGSSQPEAVTPPVASLKSTVDLTSVQSQTLNLQLDITGNVSRVEYRIDGQFVAVSYASPFNASLDISQLSAGQHSLTIIAYDSAGNPGKSQQYTFTVASQPSVTEQSQPSGSSRHYPAYTIAAGPTVNPGAPFDTTPPTTPINMLVEQSAEHDARVSWSAATDNVAVTGYEIWRNGQKLTTTTSTNYVDTNAIPGQTYSYKVRSYDAANNASSFSLTVVITMADITIFNSTDTPPSTAAADNNGIEVGLRIRPSVDGYITGVRFYKNTGNTGTHTGDLWTMTGTNLGRVTFADESATGWQTARFSSPIAVTAGTDYIVSYYAPNGNYTASASYFTGSYFSSEYLVVPSPAQTGSTGVYDYGSGPTFPQSNFQNANYWVDATFSPSSVVAPPASYPTCPAYPAFPDANCTGVVPGSTLIPYSGVLTVTRDNTTLYNLDVTGTIIVQAHNVIIVNSKIHDSDPGIQTQNGGDVAVRNSELYNVANAALMFDNWKGFNLNIHDVLDDGVKLGHDVDLEESYLHNFSPANGSHSDGGQLQDGESNVIVRHNTIDSANSNSALFLAPDLGPDGTGPILIDKNLLGGGGFTLAIVDGNNGQYHQSGYTITNNHFLRDFAYGPLHINEPLANFDLWSGNVWDDTGETIPNPAI